MSSRKGRVLRAVVDAAVDEACRAVGHGACPIARLLVEAWQEVGEPEGRPGVRRGVREPRGVRPRPRTAEAQVPRPQEVVNFPPSWPIAFAPYAVRAAIGSGLVRHVTGRVGGPVGAGGRITQSIARRVVSGGQRRRLGGGPGFFIPGEGGFG